MSEHWSILRERAAAILARSGAEVERERDWLNATWFSRESHGRRICAIIVAPGPAIEEVDFDSVYWVTPPKLAQYAADVARVAAAVRAIEEMATPTAYTVVWRDESRLECRATVADPADPVHSRFELAVLATSDDTSAAWSVWGNRRGVQVTDTCASREQAKKRAEAVFLAIMGPLP